MNDNVVLIILTTVVSGRKETTDPGLRWFSSWIDFLIITYRVPVISSYKIGKHKKWYL